MPKPASAPPLCIELHIEDLAFGGQGVAHHDGRVVLVEGGFPGDTVRARVYKRRRSLWEARAESVLEPSPDRIAPRCSHVGICGGCKLQGLVYEKQFAAKVNQVEQALRRLGGIESPPMRTAVPAPEPFEYRNKMEFSFATDRATGELICGLHYSGRFDHVFDLHECHLVPPTFARIVNAARDFLRARKVPAYDQRSHTGYARFLVVRRSVATGELLVNFVTAPGDYTLRDGFVAALRETVPEITGIVHTINDKRAQIAVGEVQDVWYGRDAMTEKLGPFEFDVSPQSFFQTNSRQAAVLYDLVVEAAAPTGTEIALDLYCGTGTIGLYLAQRVREVWGVDQVAEAVEKARENATRNNVTNARFDCADTVKWLPDAQKQLERMNAPALIVLDPPRAGLHPDVPSYVIATGAPRIVYVSCNPAALARDAAIFRDGGYVLEAVTPVDMFPQTAHIESVAVFVRG
jgi:23S rRNA (uracil1939-C5)-methyltransferase